MKFNSFSNKSKTFIFIINLVILVFVAFIQYLYQISNMKKEFNYNIENIIKKELSNNISSTKAVLTTLSSMHSFIDKMDSSEFTNLSKDILKSYSYMKAISFATIVKNEDKNSFIEEMKENGLFNFEIKKLNYDEKISPQFKTFDTYAPIIHIEPSNYKYSVFYGLDVFNSEPIKDIFQHAAKKNSVLIEDTYKTLFDFDFNVFITPTYKGELEKADDQYRLNNTNGFFIIDIEIDKLLTNIENRFPTYSIKILSTSEYNKYAEKNLLYKKVFSDKIVYFNGIDELHNSYLYISKKIEFKDFNINSFVLFLCLIGIIQFLYVIVWKKDKEKNIELNYKANHDDLTGLINRNYFRKEFYEILKRTNGETKTKAALLFIDLDRFKHINDSFGHKLGDEVLVEVAKRFKSAMRSRDIVCRQGGDEFIILIDYYEKLEYLVSIIKKVMAITNDPINYNNQKIHFTLSIGISLYPEDGTTVDELLRNADSAMYEAKDDGRNTYKFYTEDMTSKAIQKVVLENKIREAIKNDDFIVYYQSQYDALNNKLIGMEALVRWNDENQNLILPGKFIPIAEETGLIIELDRIVMKKSIEQFLRWKKEGYDVGRLSINLSMKQLKSDDFTSLFKETIIDSGCIPSDLELEITESEIMDDPIVSIEKLIELSSLGINLSVDDFGTGYSSLAYLKKLPINKLKIDRLFIKDLPNDEDDISITRSIVALAKSLKLDLIAEGVETIEQKEFLLKEGCIKIQGYLYGKPMSSSEFEKELVKINI